jgi:hypothetical protein
MSFYSPYQSNGGGKGGFDIGQGMTDIIQQVMQALMMKKYMGGGQGGGAAATPPQSTPSSLTPQQMGIQNGPIGMNKQAADLMKDPRLLAALMKLIGGGGMGGGL